VNCEKLYPDFFFKGNSRKLFLLIALVQWKFAKERNRNGERNDPLWVWWKPYATVVFGC